MKRKNLINNLELGYAPLTAYEFAIVKDDIMIKKALEYASLYIIGQRPVITFENVVPNIQEYELCFEIHQKGNPNILKCSLPLSQKKIKTTDEDKILIAFNFLDKSIEQKEPPLFKIHGFSLLRERKTGNEFIVWFSPEKFLQNWWKGYIKCKIEGDFKSFTKYKVQYVGKATKQSILKRLKGHSTFQDILSLETPVTKKQLPANEIVILPFEFENILQIKTFGSNSETDSMVAALLGEDYPEQETVFIDAEKALIKAIKPNYNKELFNKYPVSKDGLYNEKYNSISYTFMDPITLIYNEGEIRGGLNPLGGDIIFIKDNEELKLVKTN